MIKAADSAYGNREAYLSLSLTHTHTHISCMDFWGRIKGEYGDCDVFVPEFSRDVPLVY
jgi:hypothetical protein